MTFPNVIRVAIWLLVFSFLAHYIAKHGHVLSRMVADPAWDLLALLTINIIGSWLIRAARDIPTYKIFGSDISYGNLLILNNQQLLLNYLPMKAGTVKLAFELRRRFRLNYTEFLGSFVFQQAALCSIASLSAAGALLTADLTDPTVILLIVIFVAITVTLILPVIVRPRSDWLPAFIRERLELLRTYLAALHDPMHNLLTVLFFSAAIVLMTAWRFSILSSLLDLNLGLSTIVVLAALSQLSLLLSLTPAALGIREFLLGGLTVSLGATATAGIILSISERLAVIAVAVPFLLCGKFTDFRRTGERSS